MHLTSSFLLDPGCYFSACPEALIDRGRLRFLSPLLLQFSRQDGLRTRIAMAAVAQAVWTSFVVAMGDSADPAQAISRVFNDLLRGFALSQEPHDLPLAARHRVFRLAIVALDFFETEMRFDR